MARTPGLDGLLARNRKAAEVVGSIVTPDAASAPVAPNPLPSEPVSPVASQPASQPSSQQASQPTAAAREALSASADRKQLSAYVRKGIIRDARRRAEDEGTTISDVVDGLLDGWLAGRIRL